MACPLNSNLVFLGDLLVLVLNERYRLGVLTNRRLPYAIVNVNVIIKDIQFRVRGDLIDHVEYFWSVSSVFCKVCVNERFLSCFSSISTFVF